MAGERDDAFSAWETQLEHKWHGVGFTFGPDGNPAEEG
jgi:hypothetical protein